MIVSLLLYGGSRSRKGDIQCLGMFLQFGHVSLKKVREYAFDILIAMAYTVGKTAFHQGERYNS